MIQTGNVVKLVTLWAPFQTRHSNEDISDSGGKIVKKSKLLDEYMNNVFVTGKNTKWAETFIWGLL